MVDKGIFKSLVSQVHDFLLFSQVIKYAFFARLKNALVISTIHETRVLYVHSEENRLEELYSFSALRMGEATLALDAVNSDMLMQVTPSSVRLMSSALNGSLLSEWRPPSPEAIITVAAVSGSRCVLSYGFGTLTYIDVQNGILIERG